MNSIAHDTCAAISAEALNLLRQSGAMRTAHSGRTLFDHLLGTYALLRAWGNPDGICFAGLFHSIYGTNVFQRQSLTAAQRPLLQAVIGPDAEQLAWHFGHIDRPRVILAGLRQAGENPAARVEESVGDQSLIASSELPLCQWRALAEIECANLIEQGNWGNSLRDFYCLGLEQEGSLSAAAMTVLREGLAHQLRQKRPASVSKGASS